MPEFTYKVLKCLEESRKPLTAPDVQKATGLPAPIVARILLSAVNAGAPDAEMIDTKAGLAYRYIGLGVEEPKAKTETESAPAKTAKKPAPAQRRLPASSEKKTPAKKALASAAKKPAEKRQPAPKSAASKTPKQPSQKAVPASKEVREQTLSVQKTKAPAEEQKPAAATKKPEARTKPAAAPLPANKADRAYPPAYDVVATHLTVPKNMTRLARDTDIEPGELQNVLKGMEALGLVKVVVVLGEPVYRPEGVIKTALARLAGEAPKRETGPASDQPRREPKRLEQSTKKSPVTDNEGVMALSAMSPKSLEERLNKANQAIEQANQAVAEMAKATQAMEDLKASILQELAQLNQSETQKKEQALA